jgi:hypothetical protein
MVRQGWPCALTVARAVSGQGRQAPSGGGLRLRVRLRLRVTSQPKVCCPAELLQGTEPPMGTGDGDDPRSPANRGWGWGWTPHPRQIGDRGWG